MQIIFRIVRCMISVFIVFLKGLFQLMLCINEIYSQIHLKLKMEMTEKFTRLFSVGDGITINPSIPDSGYALGAIHIDILSPLLLLTTLTKSYLTPHI